MRKMIPIRQAADILGINIKALRKQVRDGKQEGQLAGHKGWVAVEEGLLLQLLDDI